MNITEELRLSCDATEKTKQEIVNYIWEWLNGLWTPDGKTIPTSTSYLRFWDTERSQYVDLSLLIDTDENPDAPLLAISQGVVVKKDFAAGGFLSSNQGALALGSGLNDFDDVPKLWLIHSELSARHNIEERADIPPTPVVDQAFVYTAPTQGNWVQNHLYRWTGTLWSDLGHKTEWDWTFDTLHLTKADGSTPAHLDVGNASIHGHLGVGDTVTSDLNPNPGLDLGNLNNYWASVVTASLYVKSPNNTFGVIAGDNGANQDTYLIPQNPSSGGLGLGTANYPFKWVNASYVYTDYLNSLSTSLHLESATETIFINDAAAANTGLELGNSSTSGGVVYIDFHYGRNTTEDYNVRLINDSDCILTFQTRTTTGGILPSSGGCYVLGTSSKDWSYVYANYLRYDVNCVQYDALDDLALVKNYKTKTIIKNDAETNVIDMVESFPFLIEENHIAHEKLQGYLLGCLKALALKVESLESEIAELKTPT